MKVKNLSRRNVGVLASHNKEKGTPFQVSIIAESTLELADEDYAKVKKPMAKLVEAGVLEITESAVTTLTAKEIVEKVKEEADVELKATMGKAKLQEKAEALGVEL